MKKITHGRWQPIWTIRLSIGSAILTCFLATVIFKSGALHDVLAGWTLGVLIGLMGQIEAFEADDECETEDPLHSRNDCQSVSA
jgi:hypothetical protein